MADELNAENLTTYLNDHLAGSVSALELIEHLAKNFPGTDLENFFADLHVEVSADQEVLRDLLGAFEAKESAVKKAGAWVVEKIGEAKLGLEKYDTSGIGFLQGLEGLALGITGKQLLWRTLDTASATYPQLRGPNYAELEARAVTQRDRVEDKRIAAARDAFRN